MGEKTILVCDTCGKPATETVTIRTSRGNFVKDLCATHANELVAGARKPRPGRRKAVVASTSKASAAPKRAGAKRGAAKRTAPKRAGAKRKGRVGRPRKRATA
jgi:hypothetical protein